MATQSNIDIKIIAEFLGKNAFKQADTAVNKLNNTVKSLGQSFGVAFGGAALGYAIKTTIRDFADAQRETQQLTNTVKNLGLAFAAPEVEAYVQSIGKLYGVTGDQAVPAMQALLTATGSVSRSTKIMNVALDLAASRNADVASVAQDLANAYVGNTRGLNQYRLGLTKAELAAMSFDEVLEKISSQTLGAADEAAKTLNGQLAILAEVSNQAKERIGGGLVQALGGLSGADGAGGAAKNIENLSVKLTNAITGFGYLVQEVKIATPIIAAAGVTLALAWAPWLTAVGVAAVAIGAIGNAMKKASPQVPMNTGKLFFPTGGDGGYKERLAAEKKAEEAATARAKKLEALAKASEKAQKDSLKLARARAILDLQKIQVEAALKGKITEEDKARLKLMKAILDENADGADILRKRLEDAQTKTIELQKAMATVNETKAENPFSNWPEYIKTAIELTNSVAQASLQAGLNAGAKLAEAMSGARYAAQAAAAAATAAVSTISGTTSSAAASTNLGTTTTNPLIAKAEADAQAAKAAATAAAAKVSELEANLAATKALAESSNIYAQRNAAVAAANAAAALEAAIKTLQQANAQAATASSAANTNIAVTVAGDPFTDPNVVAEKVVEIIREAGNRGTVDVLGFQ